MSATLVIFGASGDLTRRKLIPALYSLFCKGRLPADTQIVGVSRRDYPSADWRNMLSDTTQQFVKDEFDKSKWAEFAQLVHYRAGDITDPDDFRRLGGELEKLESAGAERVYYFATKPSLYAPAIANLGAAGLANQADGVRRVVVEKPFGTDLETAESLNQSINAVFDEELVYRIDHYLGKETVQNLMVLRFANHIFEPIWNRNYIDHVQITVAESVEVGTRAGYYDTAGVGRDMIQNHLMQLMMITAMEAPIKYDPRFVRDEKVKVLQAVRPMNVEEIKDATLRGQYEGYLDSDGVPVDSQTPTFAAIRLNIDNWRWQGVPFYLRSGKAMSCRTTQIVIQFKKPPHALFSSHLADDGRVEGNRLVVQIQPAEGIQLHMQSKVPDAGMQLREMDLDFRFARDFNTTMPDAYQRLLMDAMVGDASLFARSDEVELAWQIMDPILEAWKSFPTIEKYPIGDWGPVSSVAWMQAQGRNWFDVCPVLL